MADGGTDWGKAFGSGGSSDSGTDWGKTFGGGGGGKKSDGGGFGLHSIVDALGKAGSTVADIGVGIGGTAMDIGKSVYVLPDEMLSGKSEAQRMEDYNNRIPFLAALGWGGKKGGSGLAQTIGEAGGKSALGPVVGKKVVPIGKAYGDNPFGAALNDIANITMIAAPAASATGAAADVTNSATLAKASGALNAVAEAPGLPFKGGRSVLTSAAERAIESGTESPLFLARLGTKLTPEYQGLIGTKLEGDAQVRAVSKIVNGAADNESAIAGLRRAGYHDAADAVDALRHTATPPEVLSGNFAKVQAERAAPMPKAGPTFESPSEMVTGKEVATALHNAGEHRLGNDFMGRGMSAAEFPRVDIVRKLGESGQATAADILAAKVPKAPTGEDVLGGLREFRTEKLTGSKATETTPPAARRPPLTEPTDAPVEVPVKDAARAAVGAVRSTTESKLGGLPGVRPDYEPGLRSLEKLTNGTLDTEGYVPKVLADKVGPRFTKSTDVHGSSLLGALDPANHLYAQARLNLTPATLTGRLFGHTSLSAFGAPHPLGSLMDALRVFRGKISPESEQLLREAPARLDKGGAIPTFQRQAAEDVAGRPGVVARTTSKIDTLANKSPITRWAAKMDDALRKGMYLAERKGGAGAEDALRTVNRVAGEFDALSPAEQAIGRRLAPFYNWHKQIALIATHLAEDNPAKATMLARLGEAGTQASEQTGTPGELNIAGHAISPSFLVPFGEAGTTFKVGGAPSLGPIPKAAIGAAFGVNPNTGKRFSGPNSNKGQDYRYEGALQNLRKAFPQVNILDAITGRDQYVRYNDGSRVLKNKRPIPTNSDWVDTLASFAGLHSENTGQAKSRTASIAASAKKSSGSGGASSGATDWGKAFNTK